MSTYIHARNPGNMGRLLVKADITTTVLKDIELPGFLIFPEFVTSSFSLSPSFEVTFMERLLTLPGP